MAQNNIKLEYCASLKIRCATLLMRSGNTMIYLYTGLNTGKAALLLLVMTMLSSCSHYQFSSNLDQEPIKAYFEVGSVKLYQKEELERLNSQYLSTLEGESCQLSEIDAPANDIDARTHARAQAAKLGANGIVFGDCIRLERNQSGCITTRLCYGKAYKILSVIDEQ